MWCLLSFRVLKECQFTEKFIDLFGLNLNDICWPYTTTTLKGFLSELELLNQM